MLSEISQIKTNVIWSHLHEESKNIRLTDSRMVVAKGWRVGEMGKYRSKCNIQSYIKTKYKHSVISSRDLRYSRMTVVNNTIWYIQKLLWKYNFNVFTITTTKYVRLRLLLAYHIMASISLYMYQIITLYTLNMYIVLSIIFQLYSYPQDTCHQIPFWKIMIPMSNTK